jgi:hypothetical protein
MGMNNEMIHRLRRASNPKLYSVILILFVCMQGWMILDRFVIPLQAEFKMVDDLPMLERSAQLSFGDAFYEFIDSVRETVPDDGRVVQPSTSTDETYVNLGIIRFFLVALSIANYPSEEQVAECFRLYSGS